MKERTWMILGATSIIAEEFARLAAKAGSSLLLVGRNEAQLAIICTDLRIRYQVNCDILLTDFAQDLTAILNVFQKNLAEIDLFIAYSAIIENADLDKSKIEELIMVNVLSTVNIIHAYKQKQQNTHRLIFLSSVAACRGRAKNSLYGGSKALIEIYLEGLQQASAGQFKLTIARLGFIDTGQTFGQSGIFYASPPKACAKACWKALNAGKGLIYHPFFWRFIMALLRGVPSFIYKKMKSI
jgi:short-subunit dehydrogenase